MHDLELGQLDGPVAVSLALDDARLLGAAQVVVGKAREGQELVPAEVRSAFGHAGPRRWRRGPAGLWPGGPDDVGDIELAWPTSAARSSAGRR